MTLLGQNLPFWPYRRMTEAGGKPPVMGSKVWSWGHTGRIQFETGHSAIIQCHRVRTPMWTTKSEIAKGRFDSRSTVEPKFVAQRQDEPQGRISISPDAIPEPEPGANV